MNNEITSIGSPITTFIDAFLKQAEIGLIKRGYEACPQREAHVTIELNVVEVRQKDGKVDIRIISGSGTESSSNLQKMTIYAKKMDKVELAKKKAELEEAKTKAHTAKRQREDDEDNPIFNL